MSGLPAVNSPWPPKPHDQVLDACRERHAWWGGDPYDLARYYTGSAGNVTNAPNRSRVKRAWNAFWGRAQPTLNPPKRLHVPVAADIGRIAASTLLSEPVTFRPAEGELDAVGALVDDVLNIDENYSRMLVAAESASMLSGVYGRIVWDRELDDHTWIDYVDADRAIPEFRWGRLTGATFWTELDCDDDSIVLRHVESYRKGAIEHSLYQGSRDNIGRPIPLTEHDATAWLAEHLDGGTVISLGVDELGAEYFPNMRPNPQWRNEPALRHLGRSDLTVDVIRLLDAMDECWSSWMRDLDLGKGRVFVSEELLRTAGTGRGMMFDSDHAIYSPIGSAVKDGEAISLIEAQQFEIRVDEHQRTFEGLLRQAISRVGYSPITFGLQDEVAATATEVDAKERDTNSTRSAKIRLWSGLSRLSTTQLRVEAALFGSGAAPTEPLEVEWPDTHQESPRAIAETAQILQNAKAASTKTLVRMVNPDWDDEQVDAEVALIEEASAPPVSIMGPSESSFGDQGQQQADDGKPVEDDEPPTADDQ